MQMCLFLTIKTDVAWKPSQRLLECPNNKSCHNRVTALPCNNKATILDTQVR